MGGAEGPRRRDESLRSALSLWFVIALLTLSFFPFHSSSLYDFTVKDASGQDYNLGQQLKDKKAVLVVNVASQCTYWERRVGGDGRMEDTLCLVCELRAFLVARTHL